MPNEVASPTWKFVRFGLIVTGKGEYEFLDRFLRSLTSSGHCAFIVLARIGQLRPRTSPKHKLKIVGGKGSLPTQDEELGIYARGFINRGPNNFVLVIDDLEKGGRPMREDVYNRYRSALDGLLGDRAWKAAVFFLVNMLEAYYFAHARAVNEVLGTALEDYSGDVEDIPHPKNQLKQLDSRFDEIQHGRQIVEGLDLTQVLGRAETCRGLRSLFAWCRRVAGDPLDTTFRLANGEREPITSIQVESLDGKV